MLDYTIWDLRNEFTVREAARLWFDIDPNEDEREIAKKIMLKIKAMENVLNEAGTNQEIEGITQEFDGFIHTISRAGLRAYAESIGEKPLFLFPEERSKISIQPKEVEQAKELEPEYLFRKRRDIWEIAFEGSDISLVKDSIGLKYIHLLLGRPGDLISAFEMAQMGQWEHNNALAEYDAMTGEQLEKIGLRKAKPNSRLKEKITDEKAHARDERTRVTYLLRLKQIEEEIRDAAGNAEKILEMEEERKMLSQELQDNKFVDQSLNARVAVRMAIKRAFDQIKEHLPGLAEYLTKTIKTGMNCMYQPTAKSPTFVF